MENKPIKNLIETIKQDIFNNNISYFDNFDIDTKEIICRSANSLSLGRLLYYYHKDQLPNVWKQEFANEFRLSSAMELRRTNDLKIILELLSENNIHAALLKGNYVAHTSYPHPGLRIMCDIDILIKKDSIKNAYKLLLENGFKQTIEMSHSHHMPGLRSKNGTFIELHYHIISDQSVITEEMLWKDSYKGTLLGVDTYFLAPEVIILHTIMHAFKDLMLSGLKTFIDVAYIIKSQKPDVNKLKETAIEFGIADELRLFFNIFSNFFPDMYEIQQNKSDEQIIDKIRYLIESYYIHTSTTNQERGFENSFAGNNLLKKIQFILNATFKSKAQIAYKYKCKNKFPDIYYWYIISIFDGAKLFFKYLFQKKDSEKRKIGKYQNDLSNFLNEKQILEDCGC